MSADLVPEMEQTPEHDADDLIIRPGERPPFFIPWCASCKDTVEKFTFDFVTSPIRLGIQAECHGQTEGLWVFNEDLFARKKGGKAVVMFKRGVFDRVR